MRRSLVFEGLLTLAVLGLACKAEANISIVTVPAGLGPGSQYRLVFVTNDFTTATSSDISYYNGFATTEADQNLALAALGGTWTAIASTQTTDAISNIGEPPNVAVYDLEGNEVAGSTASMFAAPWLSHDIEYNQLGDVVDPHDNAVWTGTESDGTSAAFDVNGCLALGCPAPGSSAIGASLGSVGTPIWINQTSYSQSTPESIYAISSVLTVPALITPEPSFLTPLAIGLGALCMLRPASRRILRGRRKTASRIG
jgi:hypothetical protein